MTRDHWLRVFLRQYSDYWTNGNLSEGATALWILVELSPLLVLLAAWLYGRF